MANTSQKSFMDPSAGTDPAPRKPNPIPSVPSIPYPEDADRKIREAANKYNHPDVIQTLDKMKNELFGNAERVNALAQAWASNPSVGDSQLAIQTATENLAGYWSGPAFSQFSAYSTDVTGALGSDQSAMASMGTALGGCVSIVYNTYAAVIRLIGNTAADIVNAGVSIGVSLIPGIGEFELSNAIQAITDLLTNFVRNCTELLSSAVEQFGQYKDAAVGFRASAAGFKQLTPLPDQIGNPGSWHVNPAG